MKDFFLRLCVGCFCICSFNFLYGFYCGFFDKVSDTYFMGFFGCLVWWIVVDMLKELGWLK